MSDSKSFKAPRYIVNPYIGPRARVVDDISLVRVMRDELELMGQQFPKLLESTSRPDIDPSDFSVYTGTAGVALAMLHSHKAAARAGSDMDAYFLARANKLSIAALRRAEEPRRSSPRVTFLNGPVGPWLVRAMCHAASGAPERAVKYLGQIREFVVWLESPANDNELLYGRAGYLYACALAQRCFVDQEETFDAPIAQCLRWLIDAGLQGASEHRAELGSGPPLMFTWHESKYLGGAHGFAGIVLVMLHLWAYLGPSTRLAVCNTIAWLLDLQYDSGNFPSSLGSIDDRLVQFCHGACGFVPMLARAAEVLADEAPELAARCVPAACAAGQVIWERGLIRKGPGLCHGLSGSAYALLVLHRATGDGVWRERAMAIAEFSRTSAYRTNSRPADSALSLFEGESGLLCLYADLLFSSSSETYFPAYELPPGPPRAAVASDYVVEISASASTSASTNASSSASPTNPSASASASSGSSRCCS